MSSNHGKLVLLIWGIVKLAKCNNCLNVATAVKRDKYMEHQVFRKLRSPSLYTCASECLMSSRCLSFGFDKITSTCLLNDKDSVNGNVVDRTAFLFSDILQWSKSLSGPCSVMSCNSLSQCQVDRLGRATCGPEFLGCSQPPEVTDASKTYEGHYQGAVTTYTCKQDFTPCRGKVTSICQSTGRWEKLMTGLCNQNVWHNPALGVKYALPCGPSRAFRATVIGTPTEDTRWNIWLWKDDDVLVQTDFRFQHAGMEHVTVMDSRLNGGWGGYIAADGILPMTVGKETKIRITLRSGIYRLEIDGKNMCNFTERLPGAEPVSVSIGGSVSVRLMEIQMH